MKYSAKKLTAQYALTQAAYWMVFCGLYTFATVYLLSKGLTSSKIGIIVACGNLLGFVLQPYISGLADRFHGFGNSFVAAFAGRVRFDFLALRDSGCAFAGLAAVA